jgi:cellobiose phosphorylase
MACPIEIPAGGAFDGGFVLATAGSSGEALDLAGRFASAPAIDAALAAAREGWRDRLASHRIEIPAPGLDRLANDWLRYQAISARLWGRAGYYQQSGAYGFRDQLQDSQVWLTIDPAECRAQLRLHAGHQFADGSVVHWWHPLTEQGHVTRMTDDLLWLAFVAAAYVRETGDLTVLDDREAFLDDPEPAPLAEHAARAFSRVFARTSERGLPFIGAGDWNDGLSAAGPPAYDVPDERVGYITRYAPGLRENGGVYTHAAVWAVAAAAKAKDAELVGRLLAALDPTTKDPDRYWAEPYVLPGNVDGPASPHHGRAGWTWYTGSAAWLARIVSEWVLGVRPTWQGLAFDPCLPPGWERARMVRPYRGATVEVEIVRVAGAEAPQVTIDGQPAARPVLAAVEPGRRYRVGVEVG